MNTNIISEHGELGERQREGRGEETREERKTGAAEMIALGTEVAGCCCSALSHLLSTKSRCDGLILLA